MISLTGLMLSSTWLLLNSAKFLKSDSISYLSKFELTSPIIACLYTAAPSRIYSLDWSILEYSGNTYGIPFSSVTFSAMRCPNYLISRAASNISVSSAPVAFFSDPASTDFLCFALFAIFYIVLLPFCRSFPTIYPSKDACDSETKRDLFLP